MRVGFISDMPNYIGGAEMTMADFADTAPEGIEVVPCNIEAGVATDLDAYVAHNIVQFRDPTVFAKLKAPVVWYHHDLSPWVDETVREWLDTRAVHVFCSPLQARRYNRTMRSPEAPPVPAWEEIPPILHRADFKPNRQERRHRGRNRKGAVSIAQWRAPSKGQQRIIEWAEENGPIDIYGPGDYPSSSLCRYQGPLKPAEIPAILRRYERFVFLPTEVEPFSRTTAEAWMAGCSLTINGNIGAIYWIERDPEAMERAGEDFWALVERVAEQDMALREAA